MTKKHSPAFQFYPDDWLSDRDIVLMSPEQEGGYIRLLCFCWSDNDISIPDNDEQLSVLSRLSKGGLNLVKAKFIQHPTKPGFLTHKRLQKEHEKQRAWREKSADGGKKSAAKRAAKGIEKKQNLKGGSDLVQPLTQPNGNSPSPSPSPSNYNYKKDTNVSFIDDFEKFWSVYPDQGPDGARGAAFKGSKKSAKDKFTTIAKKEKNYEAFIRELTEGAGRYTEFLDKNPRQQAKHAVTWLNQRCWEDDYETHATYSRHCSSPQSEDNRLRDRVNATAQLIDHLCGE